MSDWTQILEYSFQSIWVEFITVLPKIIVALLVFIVGWILGSALKRVIEGVFSALKVDHALDTAGVDVITKKTGYKLNSGAFVGTLTKWFVMIVFFVASLNILGLDQATTFFNEVVLSYIPQVIVAVIILFGGLIVGSFVEKLVMAGGRATSFASTHFLAKFAHYAIVTFTVLAALNQLRIAEELVQMLFAGLVFGLSLAFGLAFGLGGREEAAHHLRKLSGRHHQ